MSKRTSTVFGLVMLVVVTLLVSCGGDKLIGNPQMTSGVEALIEDREEWLPVMPEEATAQELEALQFLYAYMPVGDVVDYSPQMYLENVRASLKTTQEMPWGKIVPNDLFMYYVLPVRVNNENLDNSRVAFYDELKERVSGLSMEDAILEVNHWCHEKAIYSSSDGRTMSASAVVRNAQGRCGEESTFATAAMRAVGIPARQVYTPRWAHTDDNHAWVEAWADGKWHYVGACEPEPVLNMGWFDGPSKRGMLMHAKVFGDYNGSEEIIAKTPIYTEINITSNYAPVASATVLVKDTEGVPVSGAKVDFGIYNYAELYPAVSKIADRDGATTLTSGLGDMVVWATDGDAFGYGQLSFGAQDTLVVVLDRRGGESYSVDFDLVPPASGKVEHSVTDEQRAANGLRLKQEDSIRTAYIASWMKKDAAFVLARELGADTSKVWDVIRTSRGNWAEISTFLKDAAEQDRLDLAFRLLDVVTVKDLCDTPAEVFEDHLTGAMMYVDRPFFEEYILEPRIGNELLVPYRAAMASEPYDIVKIIDRAKDVRLVDSLNPGRVPMSVIVAQRLGMADRAGRDAYFIAMARSKGIPARHEPVTGRLQYYDLDARCGVDIWKNIDLDEVVASAVAAEEVQLGTLMMNYSPSKQNNDPKYYSHFTVSKLTGGRYETIELSNPAADMGAGGSMRAIFATPVELEAGDYRLVSGTRMGNGTVLNEVRFFEVKAGRKTVLNVTMREDKKPVEVIGSIDTSVEFTPQGADATISILEATDRGYFVMALLAVNSEPTNHALRDIAALGSELEKWGGKLVFLCSSADNLSAFDSAAFGKLPSTITYGVDVEGGVSDMLKESLELDNVNDLPLFVVSDASGSVVFVSQGYRIGLGDQIKRIIGSLD